MLSGIRKQFGKLAKTKPELHFIADKPNTFFRFGETLSGHLKLTFPQSTNTTSLVAKLEGIE